MKVQTGKTLNKLAPIRPLQPRPVTAPLAHVQPFPKPGIQGQGQELNEAELADYARKIAKIHREIGKHQAAIAELRNEQLRLIHEVTTGSDLDGVSIEVCEFCHSFHEGICNA
jgi:hypothetical protein